MREFKVGDRVEVTSGDSYYYKKGDVGTIIRCNATDCFVQFRKPYTSDNGRWFVTRDQMKLLVEKKKISKRVEYNTKEQEAIEKSIKHWEKMIKWVEKQVSSGRAEHWIMHDALGEDWFGDHCSLCDLCDNDGVTVCSLCPLRKKYGKCGLSSKNAWFGVKMAMTWFDWLKHAKRLLDQLKSLRVREVCKKEKKSVKMMFTPIDNGIKMYTIKQVLNAIEKDDSILVTKDKPMYYCVSGELRPNIVLRDALEERLQKELDK